MNTKDTTKNSPWELPEGEPVAATRPKLTDKEGTVHWHIAKAIGDLRDTAKFLEAVLDTEADRPTEATQETREKTMAFLVGLTLSRRSATETLVRGIMKRVEELDPEGMRSARETAAMRRPLDRFTY